MNELQILSELGKALDDIAYPIILIFGLIGGTVGLLYGFFGYKLIKIGYAITGFLIGFIVGITPAADVSQVR